MDAQNEVPEPTMYESYAYEKRPDFGYCTGAEKPVENQVSEQEDSIIDETPYLSTVKDST